VPDQGHEGITMDDDGRIYTVSEAGGGDTTTRSCGSTRRRRGRTSRRRRSPSPTRRVAAGYDEHGAAREGRRRSGRRRRLGSNNLSVTGPDAASFEVDASGLYLKAGTVLSTAATRSRRGRRSEHRRLAGRHQRAVHAHDHRPPPPAHVLVTEVSPWSSGNSPYAADWFEVTNTGATPVDLTG
jgi:hypothetical protein